jgi:hypothetical protein
VAAPRLDDELFLNWEVYEDHLDEAEFLWGQWERELESPEYCLDELGHGEERLLAREDALVLGGAAVKEGLLVPARKQGSRRSAAGISLHINDVFGTPRHQNLLEQCTHTTFSTPSVHPPYAQ